jgi:cobalt/nickel transport system permease protein
MHAELSLTDIERESYKHSPIHHLDGRAKIIASLLIIFYAVSLPRLEIASLEKLAAMEAYLLLIIALAKLNPFYVALRYLLVLPFGLGIAAFQPFLRQGFIDEFTVHTLPLGLTWTDEGLLFGSIIFAKFTVCVTSIILLSSTTTMRDMVESAQRLHFPKEFALLLTMMTRYLFLFWSVLKRMRIAQASRCFSIWNKKVKRKWILEQIAYTVTSMFLRSYEQGERTYHAMLSRGYDHTATAYVARKKIKAGDLIFTTATLVTLILTHLFA